MDSNKCKMNNEKEYDDAIEDASFGRVSMKHSTNIIKLFIAKIANEIRWFSIQYARNSCITNFHFRLH